MLRTILIGTSLCLVILSTEQTRADKLFWDVVGKEGKIVETQDDITPVILDEQQVVDVRFEVTSGIIGVEGRSAQGAINKFDKIIEQGTTVIIPKVRYVLIRNLKDDGNGQGESSFKMEIQ